MRAQPEGWGSGPDRRFALKAIILLIVIVIVIVIATCLISVIVARAVSILQVFPQTGLQVFLHNLLQVFLQTGENGGMKGNELVWRTLADEALRGNRRWKSVGGLADAAGVPQRTAYLAVEKLLEIGVVERRARGIATTNPEKLLTLLGAWRSLPKDTLAMTTLDAIAPHMNTGRSAYAIGGGDAAVHYLGGLNNVADIGTRIVYLPSRVDLADLPEGEEVRVLSMDKRAEREWHTGYASLAQTYADLFATPGWQAEEFRRALYSRYLAAVDWDQETVDV